ncbi:auxin-induced in root cultures protein 12-like [Durio zibethinus]|uniref:Auxin-induced in root cultures protein 12-like n=1 Tax=Durio zibethinus TaxID=66656 RepID=A0A6P5XJ25_DURZI|nr:auxin-induced in root cultures protein 12-like [Durio zibethinus]
MHGFFYSESPDRMRSMSTALSLCSTSMGYFISSVLGVDILSFLNLLNYIFWARSFLVVDVVFGWITVKIVADTAINGTEVTTRDHLDITFLNSTLHFTYNATNSSLSIAFSAALSNANGWIAWAINPTATGMAGSRALLAFKNKGSMVVKTYNIRSYSSIIEGKQSFEVWDLEAEGGDDGTMVIYGSLKVPSSAEKLNLVWQVRPGVTNGHPMKHEFAKANPASMGDLMLVEKVSSGASSPVPAPRVANDDSGDGSRVREINAGFWILGLVSSTVLM